MFISRLPECVGIALRNSFFTRSVLFRLSPTVLSTHWLTPHSHALIVAESLARFGHRVGVTRCSCVQVLKNHVFFCAAFGPVCRVSVSFSPLALQLKSDDGKVHVKVLKKSLLRISVYFLFCTENIYENCGIRKHSSHTISEVLMSR